MKTLFIPLIVFSFCYSAIGQNQIMETKEESKFTIGFDGQVAITTNGKFSFINFGGPGLRVNMEPFVVSLNMFPSLSFYEGNPVRPTITPNLGVGFQLVYKRVILSMPLYLVRDNNTMPEYWTFSAGLGYKFGK